MARAPRILTTTGDGKTDGIFGLISKDTTVFLNL
jgi:hypothetical protein